MTVEITGATSQMQGVGRAADGRAVFVTGALPGERVTARVLGDKGRFLLAECLRVEKPGEGRRAPDCPWYASCGGCQARHMDYALSLSLKQTRVTDALTRVGGLAAPDVRAVIGMDDPTRMRNKAEYPIRGCLIGVDGGDGQVIEIDDCLLQHPLSVQAMRITRAWLKKYKPSGLKYLVTRVTRGGELMAIVSGTRAIAHMDELASALEREIPALRSIYTCLLGERFSHALHGACTLVSGKGELTDTLCGLSFRLSPQSFFQVNPVMTEKLYAAALAAADLSPNQTALDAYCGAGTISLHMARTAARVIGVEIVKSAVADAAYNARVNGLSDKTRFIEGDAAKVLPALLREGIHPDVLTVDPPRKGIDERLINAVARAGIPRVVYVSCDPATLARDVKMLTAQGYALNYAQPFDMFPWTCHVETVALLTAK